MFPDLAVTVTLWKPGGSWNSGVDPPEEVRLRVASPMSITVTVAFRGSPVSSDLVRTTKPPSRLLSEMSTRSSANSMPPPPPQLSR